MSDPMHPSSFGTPPSDSDGVARSNAMTKLMISSVRDHAMFMLDPTGNVLNWNDGATRLLGYAAKEIIGRHFSCFYPPPDCDTGPRRALANATGKRRHDEEGWLLRKDGGVFWANMMMEPVYGRTGNIIGFAAVTQDTTELRATLEALRAANEELERRVEERTRDLNTLNAELERLADTDPLTGIFNRRGLASTAERELKRSIRYNSPFSVLFIDIDAFKTINDSFGHAAGDMALQMVATQMRRQSRSGDIMARVGGDEFILLLLETSSEQALGIAERLCRELASTPTRIGGADFKTMVSIGVAQWTPYETLDDILSRADAALYKAKVTGGRGRVVAASAAPVCPTLALKS